MPAMQGMSGVQNNADGTTLITQQFGQQGDGLVSELHGKYYNQNVRGNLWMGLSASTGIALIAPATGGGHPTLFNPVGSAVNLSLVRLTLGYVSGNNAPTCIEWASTLNAGSQAATGAAILTATAVAPTNCVIGGTGTNKVIWSPTVNTFTAAPVFVMPTGFSLFTGVAATATTPFTMIADYDGTLIVAPGAAISLCTQAATTTALFQVCVVWEAIPLIR